MYDYAATASVPRRPQRKCRYGVTESGCDELPYGCKSAVVRRVYSARESACPTTLPRLQFPGDLNESAGTVSRSRAAILASLRLQVSCC